MPWMRGLPPSPWRLKEAAWIGCAFATTGAASSSPICRCYVKDTPRQNYKNLRIWWISRPLGFEGKL